MPISNATVRTPLHRISALRTATAALALALLALIVRLGSARTDFTHTLHDAEITNSTAGSPSGSATARLTPNFYVSLPQHWVNSSPALEVIVSICHTYGVTDVSVTSPNAIVNPDAYAQCGAGESGTAWFVNWHPAYDAGMNLGVNTFTVYACAEYPGSGCNEQTFTYYYENPPDQTVSILPLDSTKVLRVGKLDTLRFRVSNNVGYARQFNLDKNCWRSATACSLIGGTTPTIGANSYVDVKIATTGGTAGNGAVRLSVCRYVEWQNVCGYKAQAVAVAPAIPIAKSVTVTPSSATLSKDASATFSVTFSVGNPGSSSTTYALSALCDPAIILSGCSVTPSTTVGASGSNQVTVGPVTAKALATLTTGLIRLTATADAATATAHTAISVGPGGGAGGSAGIAISTRTVNPGGSVAREQCLSFAAGDAAGVECGELRLAHALPAFQTMSQTRAPRLVYLSRHARPIQLLAANVTAQHATPDSVSVSVAITGGSLIGVASPAARTYQWPSSCRNAPCRVVYPVNADSLGLATGLYHYTMQAQFTSGGVYSASDTGSFVVVNRSQSPYGRGWWVDGLEQLVHVNDTTKLWIGGDGSARVYRKRSTSYFVALTPISRPDTLQFVDSTQWRRRLPNAAYVRFDGAGRHIHTVNGLGHVTLMKYVSGRLDSLALPVPTGSASKPHYRFTYSSGRLASIVAKRDADATSQRTVSVAMRSSYVIDSITDPDGTSVRFDTAGTGGQIGWRRRRIAQDTVYFSYDAFGTISETKISLSRTSDTAIVQRYCLSEVRSLVACGWSDGPLGGVPLSSAVSRVDGPRSGLIDVSTFYINRFGGPDTVIDPAGGRTRIERDTIFPALPTRIVDRAGSVQRAEYSSRGLATRTIVESPLGTADSAVTSIVWHSKWTMPTVVRPPLGDSITYNYQSSYPLTNWTQTGPSSSSRVSYYYNSTTYLVDSAKGPGQVARTTRDPRLGNPATATSNEQQTVILRDTIGFERVVFDTAQWKIDTIFRGISGRIDSTRSASRATVRIAVLGDPAWDSVPSRGVTIANTYDAEGNLLQIVQTPREAAHAYATTSSAWTYDAARRARTQRNALRTDSMWYDPSGLQTVRRTARGFRISQGYDVLGRLTHRIIPGSRENRVVCSACKASTNPLSEVAFPQYGSPLIGGGTSQHVEMPLDIEVYAYDAAGRMTTANNRDARVSRAYFPNGALKADTLRLRNYEPTDTLATSYNTHVYVLTFTADKLGRRTGRTDSFGRHQKYVYDALGRLSWTSDSAVSGGGTTRFDFAYNAAGQVTSRTVAGSTTPIRQLSTYDTFGRLIDRTEEGGGPFGAATLFHDVYTYDEFGRQLTRATDGTSLALTDSSQMRYDGFGHLVALTRHRSIGQLGTFTDEFDVDALGNTWATHLNRYIAVGRSEVENDVVRDQVFSRNPQALASVRNPVNPSEPAVTVLDVPVNSYDADGNLKFIDQRAHRFWYSEPSGGGYLDHFNYPHQGSEFTFFAYDPAGRLRVSQKTVDRLPARHIQTEYRYDALGRRVMVRVRSDIASCPDSLSGITGDCRSYLDRFAWDGDQLLVETRILGHQSTAPANLESTNPPTNAFFGRVRYVHAGGIDAPVLVQKINTNAFVPHASGRGGFEAGTYLNGAEMTDYHWPQRTQGVLLGGDTRIDPATPTGWYGSLLDGKTDPTGVQYMRNRYYDPASGRFTQPDPIGLAGGLNLYGYANGDPINLSDPFGLCATDADAETDTLKTRYAHLSETCVADGEEVHAGQLLGYSGNTGLTTSGPGAGCHLHFEASVNGQLVDPLDFMLRDDVLVAPHRRWVAARQATGGRSSYGMRTHPVTGQRRMHNGIDSPVPCGTPVYATHSGRATVATRSGYGNTVDVEKKP